MLLTPRVLYPGTEMTGTTTPLLLSRAHFIAIMGADASLHHSQKTTSRMVFNRGARDPKMCIPVSSHYRWVLKTRLPLIANIHATLGIN